MNDSARDSAEIRTPSRTDLTANELRRLALGDRMLLLAIMRHQSARRARRAAASMSPAEPTSLLQRTHDREPADWDTGTLKRALNF